jgi:hypothetical protein
LKYYFDIFKKTCFNIFFFYKKIFLVKNIMLAIINKRYIDRKNYFYEEKIQNKCIFWGKKLVFYLKVDLFHFLLLISYWTILQIKKIVVKTKKNYKNEKKILFKKNNIFSMIVCVFFFCVFLFCFVVLYNYIKSSFKNVPCSSSWAVSYFYFFNTFM